jgi:hypothetical protein
MKRASISRGVIVGGALLTAAVAGLLPRADASTADAPPPLVGANYTHYSNPSCSLDGTGIVAYGSPTARITVKRQLAAMRAAGIVTLRLLLWHMHDASGQAWGVVSSAGGRISEPSRSNLIHYLSDARAAGFKRLTVVFGPEGTNDPIGFPDNNYDPSLFGENWSFIRDVRMLVEQYGPPSTHFDLLNEGAPSDYQATKSQLEDYITRIYSDYVDAFGNEDVTVSSIAQAPADWTRLPNLIEALRASGRAFPTWFEIHPAYSGDLAFRDLQATDATLAVNGLTQPVVIGETAYNDSAVAGALKRFLGSSTRPVEEVIEWPLTATRPCKDISVSPPYRADAYVTALTGSPPSSMLSASVGPEKPISLKTPYGDPVTALEARSYRVIVRDASPRANFHLIGPRVNKETGRRFRGTATWNVKLRPGIYRYWSDYFPSRTSRFRVLRAG